MVGVVAPEVVNREGVRCEACQPSVQSVNKDQTSTLTIVRPSRVTRS